MDLKRLSDLMVQPPSLPAEKILFWVTGAVGAALVPYWINWLGQMQQDLKVNLVVTDAASRFVSMDALSHMVTGEVWADRWDDQHGRSLSHLKLEQSADCFVVFPATLNSTMALAGGAAHSPALMCLQLTEKPVVVAPSFPGTNAVIREHLERLLTRPNVRLSQGVPAYSVGKRAWSGQSGAFLPLVIAELRQMIENHPRSSQPAEASDRQPGDQP